MFWPFILGTSMTPGAWPLQLGPLRLGVFFSSSPFSEANGLRYFRHKTSCLMQELSKTWLTHTTSRYRASACCVCGEVTGVLTVSLSVCLSDCLGSASGRDCARRLQQMLFFRVLFVSSLLKKPTAPLPPTIDKVRTTQWQCQYNPENRYT